MKNILTICGKEIRGYFRSPIAYLLMTIFAVIIGFFFYSATRYFLIVAMQMQFSGQGGVQNVNDAVIGPLIGYASVIGLFLIPMITMRLFAEEKRAGTIELLMTSPLRDFEIVMGKWLGAMCMYAVILGISLLDIGLLFLYGNPDWRPMLVGYLGLLLQGGALLAIGAFISTTTRNQIVAGAATFAVCLMLWVLDWISSYETAPWAKAIAYLSVVSHFDPFSKGVLDLKDVVFYLSLIFFGLFLSTRSLESLRWRA